MWVRCVRFISLFFHFRCSFHIQFMAKMLVIFPPGYRACVGASLTFPSSATMQWIHLTTLPQTTLCADKTQNNKQLTFIIPFSTDEKNVAPSPFTHCHSHRGDMIWPQYVRVHAMLVYFRSKCYWMWTRNVYYCTSAEHKLLSLRGHHSRQFYFHVVRCNRINDDRTTVVAVAAKPKITNNNKNWSFENHRGCNAVVRWAIRLTSALSSNLECIIRNGFRWRSFRVKANTIYTYIYKMNDQQCCAGRRCGECIWGDTLYDGNCAMWRILQLSQQWCDAKRWPATAQKNNNNNNWFIWIDSFLVLLHIARPKPSFHACFVPKSTDERINTI